MSPILEGMEFGTFYPGMIPLRMIIGNDWIIYRAPDMHFVGLYRKIWEILRVECERADRFPNESLIIKHWSDEMKLHEVLREHIFRKVLRDEDSSERVSDDDGFLFVQIRDDFLERYFPCLIRSVLSTGHIYDERFEIIGKSVYDPLSPVGTPGIRVVLLLSQELHVGGFRFEGLASSNEEYLMSLWSHILRDKKILFCCIYFCKKLQDTFAF